MIRNEHFIRQVAAVLALIMLRVTVCAAAAAQPGSLAILECTVSDHQMRAVWERASYEIGLDPLLLVLNEDDVSFALKEWSEVGDAINASWKIADRSTLSRTQSMLDEAWGQYFDFSFEKALVILGEAEQLLTSPGDSRLRSRLGFEVSTLKGMVHRARGDVRYKDEFRKAAAFDPEASLSPDRYSPEIITAYSRAREALLKEETVAIVIDVKPDDADILVDGRISQTDPADPGPRVFPGRHFVEVKAPGYEPWGHVIDVNKWDSPSFEFDLVQSGPDGEPDAFFLGRLKAGDRSYLARLLEKLDVDYLLIPDGVEGVLQAWLVGRDGRTAAHGKVWEEGDDSIAAVENLSVLVKPLRRDQVKAHEPVLEQMNLPPLQEPDTEATQESGKAAKWKSYAAVLGVLILVTALSGSDDSESGNSDGGGTDVEVSW